MVPVQVRRAGSDVRGGRGGGLPGRGGYQPGGELAAWSTPAWSGSGERLGLSEALLGLVAALAADAPEVTAAVTVIAGHQQRLGAGVVIGSNVFNLAALLGLGAVVAGRIHLHRRVVVLGGAVAMWGGRCVPGRGAGLLPPVAGLAAGGRGAVRASAGRRGAESGLLPLPRAGISWLRSAVAEEELELDATIRPQRARRQDAAVAAGSLLVVVAASVMMERPASALGTRCRRSWSAPWRWPQ